MVHSKNTVAISSLKLWIVTETYRNKEKCAYEQENKNG